MKVWSNIPGTCDTGYINMDIGQEVTVFRCGRGTSVFGERGFLKRTTENHLVFETESGAVVKTAIDNLFVTVGKARKGGYAVTTKKYDDFVRIIHDPVCYWNSEKHIFEKK